MPFSDFYELDVSSMSKAQCLKNGKNGQNTFFNILPFANFKWRKE